VDISVCRDVTVLNSNGDCADQIQHLTNVPLNAAGSGNCSSTSVTAPFALDHNLLEPDDIIKPGFGLSFEKIEKSEVKVDSICLEIEYITTNNDTIISLGCFEEAPGTLLLQKNSPGTDPAQWTLHADGAGQNYTANSGDPAFSVITPATYTLSESGGPGDYEPAPTPITCLGGTLSGNQLTLGENESAVCTFFNVATPEETATLTLIKEVINDDDGQAAPNAWDLSADGPGSAFLGGQSGISGVISVGTYTLSESEEDGYTLADLSCVPDTGRSGTQLTLASQDVVTCTFTNNDIPPPPPPPPPAAVVPTLSQWALILLTMMVLGLGLYARRERSARR